MCLDCGYFLYVFCLKLKRSTIYPNDVLSIVMVAFEKCLIKIQKIIQNMYRMLLF